MAVSMSGPTATDGADPAPGGRSPSRPPAGRTPADLLRLTAAILAVGAGAIHLLEAPAHYRQAAVYGRFFLVVAAAQLASGLLVALRRWPRAAYALAAYGNLTVAGVWAATRAVGIPIGPEAGERPPVASADLAATLLETTAALALFGVALAGRTGWMARLEHGRVGGRHLAVWLATLQVVLDKGQQDDWLAAEWIRWTLTLSCLTMVAFIVRELVTDEPGFTAEILAGDNPTGGFVPFSEEQEIGRRTTLELAGGKSYRYYVVWITDPNRRAHVNEVRAGSPN